MPGPLSDIIAIVIAETARCCLVRSVMLASGGRRFTLGCALIASDAGDAFV